MVKSYRRAHPMTAFSLSVAIASCACLVSIEAGAAGVSYVDASGRPMSQRDLIDARMAAMVAALQEQLESANAELLRRQAEVQELQAQLRAQGEARASATVRGDSSQRLDLSLRAAEDVRHNLEVPTNQSHGTDYDFEATIPQALADAEIDPPDIAERLERAETKLARAEARERSLQAELAAAKADAGSVDSVAGLQILNLGTEVEASHRREAVLQATVEMLTDQHETAKKHSEAMEADIAALQSKLNAAAKDQQRASARKVESLEALLAQAQDKQSELSLQLQAALAKSDNEQTRSVALEQEVWSIRASLNEDAQERQTRIDELEQELAKALAASQAEQATSRAMMALLEDELKDARVSATALQDSLAQEQANATANQQGMSVRAGASEQEAADARARVTELESSLADAQAQSRQADADGSELTAQFQSKLYVLARERDELIASKSARIESLEAELARVSSTQADVQVLQADLDAARSTVAELLDQQQEQDRLLDEQTMRISGLTEDLATTNLGLVPLKAREVSLQDELRSATDSIVALRREKAEQAILLDQLESALVETKTSNEGLAGELAALRGQVAALQLTASREAMIRGLPRTVLVAARTGSLLERASVYELPSEQSAQIGFLPAGRRVSVVEQSVDGDTTWYRISLDAGHGGWVRVGVSSAPVAGGESIASAM